MLHFIDKPLSFLNPLIPLSLFFLADRYTCISENKSVNMHYSYELYGCMIAVFLCFHIPGIANPLDMHTSSSHMHSRVYHPIIMGL